MPFTWYFFQPTKWISLLDTAKSLPSYPTLCDPIDGSPPGSPIPGILQARTLEWVAISFSNAWKVKSESEVAQSCLSSLRPHGLQPTRLLRPRDFPGKSTGVGCHCLLRFWTILQNEMRLKTWISTGLQFKFSGEVLFNSLHSVPRLRSGSFFSVLFCGKVYFPFNFIFT